MPSTEKLHTAPSSNTPVVNHNDLHNICIMGKAALSTCSHPIVYKCTAKSKSPALLGKEVRGCKKKKGENRVGESSRIRERRGEEGRRAGSREDIGREDERREEDRNGEKRMRRIEEDKGEEERGGGKRRG